MQSTMRLLEHKVKEDDDKHRKENIRQQLKKIQDFDLNVYKTVAKISKMYINTIEKKFLVIKSLVEWDFKKFWNWFKRRYIFQNLTSKQSIHNKLYGIRYCQYKNIIKHISHIKKISTKIKNSKITIFGAIIIYVLNNFNLYFRPYLTILSYNA